MELAELIFKMEVQKTAYNSLFDKLLKLPEETSGLYPGHDYNGEKVKYYWKRKKI